MSGSVWVYFNSAINFITAVGSVKRPIRSLPITVGFLQYGEPRLGKASPLPPRAVSQNVLGRRRTEAPLRRARRLGEAIGATAVVGGGHPSYPSRPGESEATETVDPGSSQDVPSPPTTTTSFFDPYTSLISYATSEIQKFGSKLHFVLNQNKVQFFQNVPFST